MRAPNHPTMNTPARQPQRLRRPTAVALVLAALLLFVACGSNGPDPNTSSERSTAESPTPPAQSQTPPAASPAEPRATPHTKVEARCNEAAPAGVAVKDVTLRSEGDVKLTAAVLGAGRRGVVLLHQTDDGICGWLSYAGYLANHDFQVLVFDRRCTGDSSCPSGDAAYHHTDDVQTTVASLRTRGAQKIAIVGASFGGSVAIGACAVVKTAGCVALSPAIFDTDLGRGLTAARAISEVQNPLLIADAPDDYDSPISDVRALAAQARPGVVQFVELPDGAGHGWDTVNDAADPTRRSAFDATLINFLDTHLS